MHSECLPHLLCCPATFPFFLQRVALCVGISKYTDSAGKLKNAARDARDLAAALKRRGFDVMLMEDPTIDQLREAVDDFCYGKMDSNTELAIFHYAGHGTFSMAGEGTTAGKHIMMSSCWKDYSEAQGGFARVSVYRLTHVLRPSSDVPYISAQCAVAG